MRSPAGNVASVHSVDRAVSILQVLARHGSLGVTDIAAEMDVHKSTVFRLLATLEARGLVEQHGARGSYHLAYGVVQLAAGATKRHDLSVTSRPLCHDLAEATGETVNIAVRDGLGVVSVDQVIGTSTVTTMNWVGRRAPIHATAAGKVFLAWSGPADLDELFRSGVETFTDHTLTRRRDLESQLADVRSQGYSWTRDEHEVGLAAIGAPIRSLEGDVIAGLVISGPTYRINDETTAGLAREVVATAAAVSERNGFPKPG